MNKFFALVAVAALASTSVVAGENGGGNGGPSVSTGQTQSSTAVAGASNQGNAQNVTIVQEATKPVEQRELTRSISDFNQNYSGSYDIRNVPGVIAPALVSSNDTCMGSSSVGAAGVGFGVSLGTSWTDKNCVMLKNSRELYNMGMKSAAMARMCMDDDNKNALELTGYVCPQTAKAKDEAAKAEAQKVAATTTPVTPATTEQIAWLDGK